MYMPGIFSDNFFDDLLKFPAERSSYVQQTRDMMRTDIKDSGDDYELLIDLPGFEKADLKLQLKEGYLTIQASRQDQKEAQGQNVKYIRRERYMGSVSRTFYIGKSLHQDDVHAKYENGILHVVFPKEEKKKEVEEKKFISIEG